MDCVVTPLTGVMLNITPPYMAVLWVSPPLPTVKFGLV